MEYMVNASQAKQIDSYAIQKMGIPSIVLMERAAYQVYLAAKDMINMGSSILVVCGTGNNGADGIAAARMLAFDGYQVKLLYIGNIDTATEEWKIQHNIIKNLNLSFELVNLQTSYEYIKKNTYDLIVDGIFGIGLSRTITGGFADIIAQINDSDANVLSVDIPSGVSADNGAVLGCAVRADVTVTFGFHKIGMVFYPGADYSGKVLVKDIGFVPEAQKYMDLQAYTYDKTDLAKMLKKRPANSHKGTFGRVLVIAGSKNMAGAAYLSAKAAYKMGAGLVRIYAPEENRSILQTLLPEAILTTYATQEKQAGQTQLKIELDKEILDWADAIVFGPGIGREVYIAELLKAVLTQSHVPLVLDADGLRVLAASEELREMMQKQEYKERIIVTPHMGEMSALTGETIESLQKSKVMLAQKFSSQYHCICVLKDARTIVTHESSNTYYINTCGNSGMATAGSGDVLTGIIAALLVQGQPPAQAASLGVLIHASAGDEAAEQLGERGVTASDIIGALTFLKYVE